MACLRKIATMALGAVSVLAGCSKQSVYISRSYEDAEIEVATREAVQAAGLNFTAALLANRIPEAFQQFSNDQRTPDVQKQLESFEQHIVRPMQPERPAVDHTFLVRLEGISPGRVLYDKDLTKPNAWFSMSALSLPEQAHVLLSSESRNNRWAADVWLIPEGNHWSVHGFWMGIVTLGNLDSQALQAMGRAERSRGHTFNAALLLAAAMETAYRGPYFQLGISESISKDLKALDFPAEVKGRPPFAWNDGQSSFRILQCGPMAIGGKLYVSLGYELPSWKGIPEAEAMNKRLIHYFQRRFPEYRAVFSGVIARGYDLAGHHNYGTVEATALGHP